jgi:hypothetical protein
VELAHQMAARKAWPAVRLGFILHKTASAASVDIPAGLTQAGKQHNRIHLTLGQLDMDIRTRTASAPRTNRLSVPLDSVPQMRPIKASGFDPWDLTLGGMPPGLSFVRGAPAFTFALAAAAKVIDADVDDAGVQPEVLIVGFSTEPELARTCADRAGLSASRSRLFRSSDDLEGVLEAIEYERPRAVIFDSAMELDNRLSSRRKWQQMAQLRQACWDRGVSAVVCGDWDFVRKRPVGLPTVPAPQAILLHPLPETVGPWGLFLVAVHRSEWMYRRASERGVVVQLDEFGVALLPDPDA